MKIMNLSLKELNELIYCVGTVMTDKAGAYGEEVRKTLYEKLTTELESHIVELERAPKQPEQFSRSTNKI
jgi:hypothetical protein